MKARRSNALLALGLLSLLGCQPRVAQFTPQDETVIREGISSALKAFTSGDWAAWAGIFSEDAILQPPNAPTVSGHAALEAWGRAFPPIERLTWPNVQVHGDGNLAYATTDYELQLKGLPPDRGKQLAVYKRETGGKWQAIAVSFSSDLPVATPAAK